LPRELSFLKDYHAIRGLLERDLKRLDAPVGVVGLDSLGQEPTRMWETPNPNNRPIPGAWLQRARLENCARRLWDSTRARDALNRLAGLGVWGHRTGPRVVDRSVTIWLCYQMQWRSRIAEARVALEKAEKKIADEEGKTRRAVAEVLRLATLADEMADETELVFLRKDGIRPPANLRSGLAEALEYLERIERDRLWVSVIGAVSEGTAETLGKDSAFGAFAVVMHALAGHAFKEQELGEMIADLVHVSIDLDIDDYRAVVRRRDTFLSLRGREIIRRQKRQKRPLA
jgi:hypothetical protein